MENGLLKLDIGTGFPFDKSFKLDISTGFQFGRDNRGGEKNAKRHLPDRSQAVAEKQEGVATPGHDAIPGHGTIPCHGAIPSDGATAECSSGHARSSGQ